MLGHRIGKLLRNRSSKVKKRSSVLKKRSRDRPPKLVADSQSSSGTPSPKLPSSPLRSESFKNRHKIAVKGSLRKRSTQPVSPLARSTSPVALNQFVTPCSSPPGSMQSLTILNTPPASPPTTSRRPERHISDSSLLKHHKKSKSECELQLPLHRTSPQTSPLLQRALSPEGGRVYRAETLPRTPRKSVGYCLSSDYKSAKSSSSPHEKSI